MTRLFLRIEVTLENVKTSEKTTDISKYVDDIEYWYKSHNAFQDYFRIDHLENNVFKINANNEYVNLNDEDELIIEDVHYKVYSKVVFGTKINSV